MVLFMMASRIDMHFLLFCICLALVSWIIDCCSGVVTIIIIIAVYNTILVIVVVIDFLADSIAKFRILQGERHDKKKK